MSIALSVEGALASLRATEVVAGDTGHYYLHQEGDYLIARRGVRDFISTSAMGTIGDSLSVIREKIASGDQSLVGRVALFASRTTQFLKSNGGDKALAIVQEILKLVPHRVSWGKQVVKEFQTGAVPRNIDGVKEALEYIRLATKSNYSVWYHEVCLMIEAIKWISPGALVSGLHGDPVLSDPKFARICKKFATENLKDSIGSMGELPSLEEVEGMSLEEVASSGVGEYSQTGRYLFIEIDMNDWFGTSQGSKMLRYLERVPEVILKAILARLKKQSYLIERECHIPLVIKLTRISFKDLTPCEEASYRSLITHLATEVAQLSYIECKGLDLGEELSYAPYGVVHAIYDYERTHGETSEALKPH